jgi:hypothetical protein
MRNGHGRAGFLGFVRSSIRLGGVNRILLAATLAGCGGGGSDPAVGPVPGPAGQVDANANAIVLMLDDSGVPIVVDPGVMDANESESGGLITVTRQAQMVSVPPTFVLATEEFSYSPKHTRAGATDWNIVEAPAGVVVRERRVVADPGTLPPGEHTVVIEAMVDDNVVRQRFPLTVAVPVQRARRVASPNDATQVSVQSETSRVRRSAVAVPEGAVEEDTVISINEVDRVPTRTSFREVGPVVDFGPSGTVFRKRATVSLPLDSAMMDSKNVGAFTFNTKVGRWDPVEVLGIDKLNKLVIAKASHFSMYMAAESAFKVESTIGLMSSPLRCEGDLSVQSILNAKQSDVLATSINNLSPELKLLLPEIGAEKATLGDLLMSAKFRGTLRVVYSTTLFEGEGTQRTEIDSKATVASLFVGDNGKATVTVSDAVGNILESNSFPDVANNMAAIWLRLSGASAHTIFSNAHEKAISSSTRVHLIYFPDNRTMEGVSIGDLGPSVAESLPGESVDPGARANDFDADCDQVLGGYDGKDGRFEPVVVADPVDVASIFAGDRVRLSVRVVNVDATPSSMWKSSGGVLETTADDPGSRQFSSTTPGRYTVSFVANGDGKTLSHDFVIDVSTLPVVNTPPTCSPVASANSGLVGEVVAMRAIVADKESPEDLVKIEWGMLNTGADPKSAADDSLVPSGVIESEGVIGKLSLKSEGTFVVGCRAYDGKVWGPIESTTIGAIAKGKNQGPGNEYLSPPGADILVGQSIRLVMGAKDPEKEKLAFFWESSPKRNSQDAPLLGIQTDSNDRSEITFTGTESGIFEVRAWASDGEFSTSVLVAKILVRAKEASKIDNDKDGFSAGTGPGEDCNDADVAVNPDAYDICGNPVDENCDGVIPKDDCDGDGFPVCVGNNADVCDCDDSDRTVNQKALEYCDGRDNNCDGKVDEGFAVGTQCTVGLGACQAAGKTVCTPDGQRALCAGVPVAAKLEVCDGQDNDCDAVVDEDNVCIAATEGVYFKCAVPEKATDDPAKFANCAILANEGFQLRQDGAIVLLSAPKGAQNFDPKAALYCWHNQGTWKFRDFKTMIVQLPDSQSGKLQEEVVEIVVRAADGITLGFADARPNMSKMEQYRRVPERSSGKCDFDVHCRPQPEVCNNLDDNCDGKIDEGLMCPAPCDRDGKDNNGDGKVDEPGEPCMGPIQTCDRDGKDNNGDGKVDEPGEPCMGPIQTCDRDGKDNNGDGKVDEPGEPCAPFVACDMDKMDNNGDGKIDEPGEPCGPAASCDKDGKDNNNNGKIDEIGEPCGPSCDMDRIDNNGDGKVDEPGEACGPGTMQICDKDGKDNNNNAMIDEPGEPCGPSCDMDRIDNNGDGKVDEPGESCGPGTMQICDKDGKDNNNNAMIDEPGEPCYPPATSCDKDGKDNNGNAMIDEPGEPCYPPATSCDKDGKDNNGNAMIDEPGEPCYPPATSCDKDGKDNNNNAMIDEPGEPCGPPIEVCDKDGKDNNNNAMIDEPGEACYPPATSCDKDGKDNNGNAMIDEPGEPCYPPATSCDKDGKDNNNNAMIDEPGEPCGPPIEVCDKDGKDNNNNAMIDEPGEACYPPATSCDKDGKDNNNNAMIDEPGEPCGLP